MSTEAKFFDFLPALPLRASLCCQPHGLWRS